VSLIENERTKLTATFFNTLATAIVAAGGFAPLAAMIYGLSSQHIEIVYVAVGTAICATVGATLHFAGRRILGRLQE
jgi:hypothetical protein